MMDVVNSQERVFIFINLGPTSSPVKVNLSLKSLLLLVVVLNCDKRKSRVVVGGAGPA